MLISIIFAFSELEKKLAIACFFNTLRTSPYFRGICVEKWWGQFYFRKARIHSVAVLIKIYTTNKYLLMATTLKQEKESLPI
jgi:hypothetical protein